MQHPETFHIAWLTQYANFFEMPPKINAAEKPKICTVFRAKSQKCLRTLKDIEPVRLPVIFRTQNTGIEENEDNDEPVEPLRLNRLTTGFATSPSPDNNSPSARNVHCRSLLIFTVLRLGLCGYPKFCSDSDIEYPN